MSLIFIYTEGGQTYDDFEITSHAVLKYGDISGDGSTAQMTLCPQVKHDVLEVLLFYPNHGLAPHRLEQEKPTCPI